MGFSLIPIFEETMRELNVVKEKSSSVRRKVGMLAIAGKVIVVLIAVKI